MKTGFRHITRTVWVLSVVSLFTDTASEMLYPVLPVYLKTIGFSVLFIGILEGIAEATAGLSKGYFGNLSDVTGKRVPFVRFGYMMSAVAKPLMIAFTYPLWIFFVRTADRFGKGIRTGARDAMLSDEATPATKGKIFGFHRSMDTFGAVIGPAFALAYLYFYPADYKTLFLIAFIPGILAIVSTLLLKEKPKPAPLQHRKVGLFSFLGYWKTSPLAYRRIVIGLLVFTLFNSSDVFLLLRVKDAGMDDTMVIGLYIFYNLIYALFSYPLGILADRIGLKPIFISGLVIFAIVYFGMALNNDITVFIFLFFLYGIFAAATEGISKAWITNMVDSKDTATAVGTYTGFQSICAMIASTLAGFLWFRFGAPITFYATATVTGLVVVYFVLIPSALKK